MSAAALKECRAILGGERDKMRLIWDERASEKDRKVLLAMAGATMAEAHYCKNKAWGDMRASLRGDITRGLARFSGWAAALEGDA